MKGRRAIKFRQLLAVIATSLLVGFAHMFYDYFFLRTPAVAAIGSSIAVAGTLSADVFVYLVGGTVGGILMVYVIQERLRQKPYVYTITVLLAGIIMIVLAASFIGLIPYSMFLTKKPLNDPATRAMFNDLMFRRVNPVFFILIPLVVVQQLMLQVFDKFGPGAFWKIARGTYYKPKNENRIFMFADLNSSTTIAEKLGNERYHELLKDFFADITNPILDNGGEIYQYLGDGIIIDWIYHGDERDVKCVDCFFEMRKEIEANAEKYQEKFGVIPQFKAGMHSGEVVVGEIGIIKRDITYSGDVLNTTSRIQSMCHELNSEMLISGDLLLAFSPLKNYVVTSVGGIRLRGKEKEVALSSIQPG